MSFVSTIPLNKVSIGVYNYTLTDDGYGSTTPGYSASADYTNDEAIMYEGSQAERVVSEKIKTEVYAVILIDWFSSWKTTIYEKDKLTVNNNNYSIISIEDIGHQNEVLQIAIKEFK
jgi:hypothetical protein